MLFHLFFISGLFLSSSATLHAADAVIAFGSCVKQDKPQPVWSAIQDLKPDVFLLLGDNVYADTTDPKVMQQKYNQLAAQSGYQALKESIPVYATWDDHDYGSNDIGEDNPIRAEAEQIFLDFFEFPVDAPARQRPGIYHTRWIEKDALRIQLIMLDTRYFRGQPVKAPTDSTCPYTHYAEQRAPDVTVLGGAQWSWLEDQLREPADYRIIASSIQVIPDEHCWEKWANFPVQRQKLFDLIASTGAANVLLISGDRHLAEISRITLPGLAYPLLEFTSSSMNASGAGKGEPNRFRTTPDNFRDNNFGVIYIDQSSKTMLTLELRSEDGHLLHTETISQP